MRIAGFATAMVLLAVPAAQGQSATAVAVLPSAPAPNIDLSSQAPASGAASSPMTPVDLAWFDAEHDDHHLVKINEIILP